MQLPQRCLHLLLPRFLSRSPLGPWVSVRLEVSSRVRAERWASPFFDPFPAVDHSRCISLRGRHSLVYLVAVGAHNSYPCRASLCASRGTRSSPLAHFLHGRGRRGTAAMGAAMGAAAHARDWCFSPATKGGGRAGGDGPMRTFSLVASSMSVGTLLHLAPPRSASPFPV